MRRASLIRRECYTDRYAAGGGQPHVPPVDHKCEPRRPGTMYRPANPHVRANRATVTITDLTVARQGYTNSLSSFAGRKAIFLLAAILMDAPVAGLRPIRAGRERTCRMPRRVRRILSPFWRCSVASVTRSPSTASASFFGRSWLSASSAAICLSVMVTCGAAFAAAAFLAGAAAFLAVTGGFFAARAALTGTAAFLTTATAFAGTGAFLAAAAFLAGGISISFENLPGPTCFRRPDNAADTSFHDSSHRFPCHLRIRSPASAERSNNSDLVFRKAASVSQPIGGRQRFQQSIRGQPPMRWT